ncbi:MAG: phage virion morphogenesis protein [Verrucomicrobiota bacterium]
MTISLIKTKDAITPALRAKLKRVQNPRPALEAMGLAVVSLAKRSFTTPSVRAAAWAPLKPATIKAKQKAGRSEKILQRTCTLAKSPRITKLTTKNVTVGSDRKAGTHSLAAIHQLGAPKANIPARPIFPFDKAGRPTDRARKNVLSAGDAALRLGEK